MTEPVKHHHDRFNTLSNAIRHCQTDGLIRVLYQTSDRDWHTALYGIALNDLGIVDDTFRYILPCGEVTKLA